MQISLVDGDKLTIRGYVPLFWEWRSNETARDLACLGRVAAKGMLPGVQIPDKVGHT